jgi:hypothetical protein
MGLEAPSNYSLKQTISDSFFRKFVKGICTLPVQNKQLYNMYTTCRKQVVILLYVNAPVFCV